MKKNKKAQIRMAETIGVLFIFFILVIFGIIFYYQFQKVALKEKQEEFLANRAIITSLKTVYLPELTCTKGEAEAEGNCFDLFKLRDSSSMFQGHLNDYYYHLFGYANISITKLYPLPQEKWVIYAKEKPSWKSKEPTYFTVSLRDESTGSDAPLYNFGYLQVEVYS